MNSSTENADDYGACEFRESLRLLRQIYLFARLPMEALKVFAYLCARERFRAGDALIRQGEDDAQAFLLLEGTARLIREEEGTEREIRTLGPETFLGGMSLLTETPRLFTVRAETDLVCMVLSRKRFRRALEQFPDIFPKLMGAVAGEVHAWESRTLVGTDLRKREGVSLV